MTEPKRDPGVGAGSNGAAGRPGIPRWVKAFGLVVGVLVVVLLLAMLLLDGEHGPGRHLSSVESAAARPVVPLVGPGPVVQR